ncbi:MAG TPA: arylamine N-acetyltransferase [Ignavibacteriales bacterium]|nr:arylamine N-acetyltransferase [Ignavibacteriales bacterium]
MDINAYLNRINYKGPLKADAATLKALHRAHMTSIPFENLSIGMKEPVILTDKDLFQKIILRKRGGFCYELNGLFASLLRELGFNVSMLSAAVAKRDGGFGPDFDHMALLVKLGEDYLADVGFGDLFLDPILLKEGIEQKQGNRTFRIDQEDKYFILNQRDRDDDWKKQYHFTLEPHGYEDFSEMCQYNQTSPKSHFTQHTICSLATPEGRITISDKRLIITEGENKQERLLTDNAEYYDLLNKHFGIKLSAGS